jgi:hypothetical protein
MDFTTTPSQTRFFALQRQPSNEHAAVNLSFAVRFATSAFKRSRHAVIGCIIVQSSKIFQEKEKTNVSNTR